MRVWKTAWQSLKHRSLHSILSVLLLSFSTGLVLLLLHAQERFEASFKDNIKNIDMVVGAKGSPLQIILASVYHIDPPTGNIPLEEFEKLSKNPLVKESVPLSYGDNYQSWRIVGTSQRYAEWYGVKLASGKLASKSMEVCLGAAVAEATGLQIGDQFEGSHGLQAEGDHHHHPFKVVGIYQASGTVIDELILSPLSTLWEVHHSEGPKEITAGLFRFKSPMANLRLPRLVNKNTSMQAALPAIEVNRLFSLGANAILFLNILAYIMILIASLSVFLALFQGLKDDEPQLAFLRAIGSPRKKIITLLLGKGLILAFLAFIAAVLFNLISFALIGQYLSPAYQIPWHSIIVDLKTLYTFLSLCLIVGVASLLPAWHAYRINIIKSLQDA